MRLINYRCHLTIENNWNAEKRYNTVVRKQAKLSLPPKKLLGWRQTYQNLEISNAGILPWKVFVASHGH